MIRLVAVVLALAVPSLASAQGQPGSVADAEAAVAAMLGGIEDAPSIAEWRALGPEVVPVLARLAADPEQPGFVRLRAIQAAGAFATEPARAMLRRGLRSPDALVVREAALALSRAFGAGALADVAPLLAHRDTAVREAAIRALGGMDDEGARARLRARLAREPDEVLRAAIQEELSRGESGAARDG